MISRPPILAAMLLVGASGCGMFAPDCNTIDPQPPRAIPIGLDDDLHALTSMDLRVGNRRYHYFAAGAAGAVAVWGDEYPDNDTVVTFVDRFRAGDADLRGAWVDWQSWWVVGDGGTILVSDNRGESWSPVELPTTANFHAITGLSGRPIVVGDEALFVRLADGSWIEPLPPFDDWGQLRGVTVHDARVYVVGLGGMIWSARHPEEEWVAEVGGGSNDLLAVGWLGDFRYEHLIVAVGSNGTVLVRDDRLGVWSPVDTDVTVDLIDVHRSRALGAGGEVFLVHDDGALQLIDTLPGSRAIARHSWNHLATVGASGLALYLATGPCEF